MINLSVFESEFMKFIYIFVVLAIINLYCIHTKCDSLEFINVYFYKIMLYIYLLKVVNIYHFYKCVQHLLIFVFLQYKFALHRTM